MRVAHLMIVYVLVAVALSGCTAGSTPSPGPTADRTLDEADLLRTFDGLGASPFGPDGRPTLDGRRVLDVLALQGALINYRTVHRVYPAALSALEPGLAGALPRDPGTGQAYEYRSIANGADYELRALLSNGRPFYGAPVRVR